MDDRRSGGSDATIVKINNVICQNMSALCAMRPKRDVVDVVNAGVLPTHTKHTRTLTHIQVVSTCAATGNHRSVSVTETLSVDEKHRNVWWPFRVGANREPSDVCAF